ncbi:hypothetical protein [Burkholderia pyrrocinia]
MDWGKVLDDMLKAAEQAAGAQWPTLNAYAQQEFQTLTGVATQIEARKVGGTISEVNAQFLAGQYEAAAKSVLYAVEGLSNIVIQSAWNAAMAVLRTALNDATGWALL